MRFFRPPADTWPWSELNGRALTGAKEHEQESDACGKTTRHLAMQATGLGRKCGQMLTLWRLQLGRTGAVPSIPVSRRVRRGQPGRPERISVDESADRRVGRKIQAGGFEPGSRGARSAPSLDRDMARAAGEANAFKIHPGRSMTAIGICQTMSRQRRQRWSCARLSAPITQTKCVAGNRRFRNATVAKV